MQIAITGAGSLGCQIAQIFLKSDYNVLLLDKSPDRVFVKSVITTNNKNLSFIKADVRDREHLATIVKKFRPTCFIHTAAILGGPPFHNQDPTDMIDTNLKGTVNVAEVALRYETQQVVYCSSLSIYGKNLVLSKEAVNENMCPLPLSFYGISKLAGELFLQSYARNRGLKVAILRFAGVYGPSKLNGRGRMSAKIGNIIAALIKSRRTKINREILGINEYLYIKDAAMGVFLTCRKGTDFRIPLNIGFGKTAEPDDIAQCLKSIFPDSTIVVEGKNTEYPTKPLDISRARGLIGYEPQFDLYSGLIDYTEYIRKNIGK